MDVAGIVLAAGAGRRMGRPKALMRDEDGVPWLHRAVGVLREAGAGPVLVTLGASAGEAAALMPSEATAVVVPDWRTGMAASLRSALEAAEDLAAEDLAAEDLAAEGLAGEAGIVGARPHAALVTLVDLPDLRARAALRVLGAGSNSPGPDPLASALRQATYDGVPGHPVLIGRQHWEPLRRTLRGDAGARHYLREHDAEAVDCTDLGGGADVDRP